MRRVPAGHRSSWSPTNQDSGLGALVPTCVECSFRGVSPAWSVPNKTLGTPPRRRLAAGSGIRWRKELLFTAWLFRCAYFFPDFSVHFLLQPKQRRGFSEAAGPEGISNPCYYQLHQLPRKIFHHEKNRYWVPFCCGTRENVAASGCRKLPPHISPQKARGYFICPVPAHRQFLLAAAGSGHRQRLTCCTGPGAAFALREAAGNPPFPSQQRARDP